MAGLFGIQGAEEFVSNFDEGGLGQISLRNPTAEDLDSHLVLIGLGEAVEGV
jgi:hypothetical protein